MLNQDGCQPHSSELTPCTERPTRCLYDSGGRTLLREVLATQMPSNTRLKHKVEVSVTNHLRLPLMQVIRQTTLKVHVHVDS